MRMAMRRSWPSIKLAIFSARVQREKSNGSFRCPMESEDGERPPRPISIVTANQRLSLPIGVEMSPASVTTAVFYGGFQGETGGMGTPLVADLYDIPGLEIIVTSHESDIYALDSSGNWLWDIHIPAICFQIPRPSWPI